MTTISPPAALVPVVPLFSEPERLALDTNLHPGAAKLSRAPVHLENSELDPSGNTLRIALLPDAAVLLSDSHCPPGNCHCAV